MSSDESDHENSQIYSNSTSNDDEDIIVPTSEMKSMNINPNASKSSKPESSPGNSKSSKTNATSSKAKSLTNSKQNPISDAPETSKFIGNTEISEEDIDKYFSKEVKIYGRDFIRKRALRLDEHGLIHAQTMYNYDNDKNQKYILLNFELPPGASEIIRMNQNVFTEEAEPIQVSEIEKASKMEIDDSNRFNFDSEFVKLFIQDLNNVFASLIPLVRKNKQLECIDKVNDLFAKHKIGKSSPLTKSIENIISPKAICDVDQSFTSKNTSLLEEIRNSIMDNLDETQERANEKQIRKIPDQLDKETMKYFVSLILTNLSICNRKLLFYHIKMGQIIEQAANVYEQIKKQLIYSTFEDYANRDLGMTQCSTDIKFQKRIYNLYERYPRILKSTWCISKWRKNLSRFETELTKASEEERNYWKSEK